MVKSRQGFTLIELMLTVAIIGMLSAIAIPRFGSMVNKAHEAATRGSAGSLRSAISIYYADNDGYYPTSTLPAVLIPKYLGEIPTARLPMHNHPAGRGISHLGLSLFFDWPNGVGGYLPWAYVTAVLGPSAPRQYGELFIFCSHRDIAGAVWSDY